LTSAGKVEKENNQINIVEADQEVKKQKAKIYRLRREEYLIECLGKYLRKK